MRLEFVQQNPVQRPLEEVDFVVGLDERGNVLREEVVLRRHQAAQRRQRDIEQRQARPHVELLDERHQPACFLVHPWVGRLLQVSELALSGRGLMVEQQRVDEGARAVRFVSGADELRRQALDEPRGVLEMRLTCRLPHLVDGWGS